jgi:hypothetical protein
MSDIDRVFARLGGGQPAAGEQRGVRSIPRRGATGSRVVEVVRMPPRREAGTHRQSRRVAFNVHAQTWEDGFPARSLPCSPEPTRPAMAELVAHPMPMWERAADEPALPPRGRRAAQTADGAGRRVADPFDMEDDRANCLRCGYVIEPGRGRRGLMTCPACG